MEKHEYFYLIAIILLAIAIVNFALSMYYAMIATQIYVQHGMYATTMNYWFKCLNFCETQENVTWCSERCNEIYMPLADKAGEFLEGYR